MDFRCMFCGVELEAPEEAIAQEEDCPNCGISIRIPPPPQKKWEHQKPTVKQLDHIKSFGVEPFQGITKGEASKLIERLHEFHSHNQDAIKQYIHNLYILPDELQESVDAELKKRTLENIDESVAQMIIQEGIQGDLHGVVDKPYDFSDINEAEDYIEEYLKYKYQVKTNEDGLRYFALQVFLHALMTTLAEMHEQIQDNVAELTDDDDRQTAIKQEWYNQKNDIHKALDKILKPYLKG